MALLTFLHTFSPSPVLGHIGPLTLYWYGFFYAVSIVLGYWLVHSILQQQIRSNNTKLRAYSLQLIASLSDLAFYLIIVGLIGARLYHVLNEPTYYWAHPWQIPAIWNGGLAIHGALIADLLFLWFYSRKREAVSSKPSDTDPLQPTSKPYSLNLTAYTFLLDTLAPAMLLGQAIGRFGNYFNQELFGYPTSLPWGIPIALAHRPPGFESYTYFHPTFLYEFLWDLVGAIILLVWQYRRLRHTEPSKPPMDNGLPAPRSLKPREASAEWGGEVGRLTAPSGLIFFTYLTYMALGRLLVELLRVDTVPMVWGWRLPLLMSAGLGMCGIIALTILTKRKIKSYT